MGKLDGKIAIVTGGAGWLGQGICRALAKDGANLAIADINEAKAAQLAAELLSLGRKALVVAADVSDEGQAASMVDRVVRELGAVDILVNAAQSWGNVTATHRGWTPIEGINDEQWDLFFRTGVKATLYCCKAVFPHMKDRGGKIVNFASITGVEGWEGTADYSANKEAIRGLSRVMAHEWGPRKINVNVICPSALQADMIRARYGEGSREYIERKKFIDEWVAKVPMRRVGNPEKDIGRVIAFLASEDSDFITGHTFMVDGGAHMF